MVGGPGACDGHEDPNFAGPSPASTGGYSSTITGSSSGNSDSRDNAQRKSDKAKERVISVAKAILKIAMDIVGITSALDCFTTGDLGACLETGLNVLMSFVGGLAGKIVAKYAFRFKAAYRLGKRLWKLADELVDGVKEWRGARKLLKECHSFDPETEVVMADGSHKKIKDIELGDKVLATDPASGKTYVRTVTTLFTHQDTDLADVTVQTADGRLFTLKTTQNHPFWDQTIHSWLNASDLKPGISQTRSSDGRELVITAVRSYTGDATMRDLTIDTTHTYYVLAGKTPVLVHNVDECDITAQTLGSNRPGEGVSAARGDRVGSDEQRMINEFGDRNGCSTCGARESGYADGHWTGDHQPPNKLAPKGPWTLYPQCQPCARQQGGIVNGLNRGWYNFIKL
jgi:hypothetical protein